MKKMMLAVLLIAAVGCKGSGKPRQWHSHRVIVSDNSGKEYTFDDAYLSDQGGDWGANHIIEVRNNNTGDTLAEFKEWANAREIVTIVTTEK